jgi:acetyltransferase-like isoleucine patch superfamily enzyme
MPETKCFRSKRILYRLAGVKIGMNVRICSSVTILGNGLLSMGDNTWIGHQTCIISTSSVVIGNDVDIAPRVYLGTGSHEIDIETPGIAGKGINKDIEISNGCWIGAGAIVLPGAFLGEKSIIAAGAVVKGVFNPYSLIGGVPAKFIKILK